jgi:hypothetical protein
MSKSQLSDITRRWIKQRKKEDQRLEFKKRIDLSTSATKAEFIRDVISLANSDGEYPREVVISSSGSRMGSVLMYAPSTMMEPH